jgi:5-methylcytosine-specific restriction endonuclease McrA
MTDEGIDPELQTLLGMAAELTAIRRELTTIRQALVDEPSDNDSDTGDELTCQFCGQSFTDDSAAREHTISDHNAPPDAWRESYE